MRFVGVVAGATGATGRWIVEELVNEDQCEKVFALVRSSASRDALSSPKVTVIDWNELKQLPSSSLPLVGFCALGSAPYSEEADFIAPKEFATNLKNAGCDSMFLVSAASAKAGSWIGYSDTIGRREEALKALGFNRLGIYRPGMMERQEMSRFKERFFSVLLPSCWKIDTRDIAKAMVRDAINLPPGTTRVVTHSEMKQ